MQALRGETLMGEAVKLETIKLGSTKVAVTKKDIKNIHLSVHPPSGAVRISAPSSMKSDTIRTFAITKLDWIKKQQKKFLTQARRSPLEYIERESHYLWGQRYLLKVIEHESSPIVELKHKKLHLYIKPSVSQERRAAIIENWYRQQLAEAVEPLIKKWESAMGVKVKNFQVRKMKARWGSCDPSKKIIRINAELARKPVKCLEYIVVHEMTHLLERSHNQNFIILMNKFLPSWRTQRDSLNSLPVKHENWV